VPRNSFFLISFLPALAYWGLESFYDLKTALIGGTILCFLEISLEKIFTKHVHSISVLNFTLIVGLGAISLIASDGIWFKLQPFFTGVIMFIALIYKNLKGESFMLEVIKGFEMPQQLPESIMKTLEKHLAFFLLFYGFFMAYLAFYASTARWTFFKTIGLYLCFFVFMVFEMLLIRRKLQK